jgi:hypothetical protein
MFMQLVTAIQFVCLFGFYIYRRLNKSVQFIIIAIPWKHKLHHTYGEYFSILA